MFQEAVSFGLDISPYGTAKGIIEGLSGKDIITQEDLNLFDRTMCFVGAIPLIGPLAKGTSKTAKFIRRTAKAAKWVDEVNDLRNGVDLIRHAYDEDDDEE